MNVIEERGRQLRELIENSIRERELDAHRQSLRDMMNDELTEVELKAADVGQMLRVPEVGLSEAMSFDLMMATQMAALMEPRAILTFINMACALGWYAHEEYVKDEEGLRPFREGLDDDNL